MTVYLSAKPQIKVRVTHQTYFDREARGLELSGPPSGDGRLLLDEQAVQKLIVFLKEQKLANIVEVKDGGESPNAPTIEELRASQKAGSEGIGTNKQSFPEMEGDFDLGCGGLRESADTTDEAPRYNGLPFLGRE